MVSVKHIVFSTFLVASIPAFSQTDSVLDHYLETHRYVINQAADSSLSFPDERLPHLLERCMKEKFIFMYGESFSHALHFNAYALMLFTKYFETRGLKYYFEEAARSWIVEDNIYFHSHYGIPDSIMKADPPVNDYYRHLYEREKEMYMQGHYEYRAIDFERVHSFHNTLSLILSYVNPAHLPALCGLAPYLRDTYYVELSPKKFVQFYEAQRDHFFADSNNYKPLLDTMYPYFRYLLSDSRPSLYQSNRDKNMAFHILKDIGIPQQGTVYFIDQGMAHTRRIRAGLVGKTSASYLNESGELKGRLLVVDTYCQNCIVANPQGGGDNSMLTFMKGAILASFQQATAANTITLFDLTELPAPYAYIRDEYNDLLIFAKNQN